MKVQSVVKTICLSHIYFQSCTTRVCYELYLRISLCIQSDPPSQTSQAAVLHTECVGFRQWAAVCVCREWILMFLTRAQGASACFHTYFVCPNQNHEPRSRLSGVKRPLNTSKLQVTSSQYSQVHVM